MRVVFPSQAGSQSAGAAHAHGARPPRRSPSRRQWLQGAAAFLTSCSAQRRSEAADEDGRRPALRRGIGVHNLLNWPQVQGTSGEGVQYVWPAFEGADYRISADQLAALRTAGFDFIRLTVDPSIFISIDPPRRPELHRHARATVDQLIGAGFSVVFDLHPVAVNPRFSPGLLVSPDHPETFQAYATMVERVARMLRELPTDKVAFELFNEPWIESIGDAPRWQAMLQTLHDRARQGAPDTALVLGGVQWNSIAGLLALDVTPFRHSNVFYTVHYYDPHAFTHQGVRGQDTEWLAGLRWPITAANLQMVQAQAMARIQASGLALPLRVKAQQETGNYIGALAASKPGPAQVQGDFARLSRWMADQRLRPSQILVGEFGCTDSAAGVPVGKDRLDWLRAVRTDSERAGLAWSYWAYEGGSGMTLAHSDGSLDAFTLQALGLNTA